MGDDKSHVANVGMYLEMGEFGHEKFFGPDTDRTTV